ncbi:siderophore-interacting protein [Cellulomonas timonensis]|uniref:siderophore-interacting protein n=1 Tax=Cellulomonas timonensis TaxID=1689271 RepID=UPI0008376ECF|nr:siderophore-interacting protein [Cellulomonas timonensis]
MSAAAARPRPTALRATVLRTERLTPTMVRLVLGGPGLAPFTPSEHADSYVKLVFLPPAAAGELPLTSDDRVDLDALRAGLPADQQPRLRSYTVRAFDPQALELTVDVVVHGEEGIAGPWADGAQPGDEILVVGPGGAYSPAEDADWHLLIGDASALPAIAVALERMGPDAQGHAFVEVHHAEDEIPLTAPEGVQVHWVHRGHGVVGLALVEAVQDLPWPDGVAHAFVHGEAGTIKELRHHLRAERGIARDRLSISGYWRLGADDEAWRAAKKAWTGAIEADEQAAGLD